MCTRPKKGFPIGLTPDGKTKYAITDHLVETVKIDSQGRWTAFTASQCDELRKIGKFTTLSTPDEKWIFEWIPLPCGKCPECKLDKSREWANRLMMERKYSRCAYFITITYSDDFVPKHYYADPETGEAFPSLTLVKRDVQLWLKRLRKAFAAAYGAPVPYDAEKEDTWHDSRRVRYYLAGEYGKKTFRPHYHCILFSPPIPDDDRVLVGRSETGGLMYNYPWLDKTWNKGFVTVSEVTWETCAYVARYCLKKRYGAESDFYTVHNIEPEFSLQSTNPGIGALYYKENPGILDYDFITLSTERKGLKFPPPRYFRKLREKHFGPDPRQQQRLDQARVRDEHLLDNSTLSYDEYMELRERAIDRKVLQLRRSLEDEK